MSQLLSELLKLKPAELAEGIASVVGAIEALLDMVDGDEAVLDELKAAARSLKAHAEAVAQLTGGATVGELAEGPVLYAGGSGREGLEADLLAEARGSGPAATPAGAKGGEPSIYPTPAPSGTKGPGSPPPVAPGGEDARALAEQGVEEWSATLPKDDWSGVVDRGTPLRWVEGQGWSEGSPQTAAPDEPDGPPTLRRPGEPGPYSGT